MYIENNDAYQGKIRNVIERGANIYNNQYECKYGIIDYEYTKNLYQNYDDIFTGEYIVNNQEIESCEDDPIVMSCWTRNEHETMVYNATESDAYQAVYDGARYPDEASTLSVTPELHGGGITNSAYYGTNYVACYCLTIRCANALYYYEYNNNDQLMTKAQLKNVVGDEVYSIALKNIIDPYGDSSYSNLINEIYDSWKTNKNFLNKNKTYNRRFTYGIAMHILADSFAHSVYKKYNDNWTHLIHNGVEELKADNPNICWYRHEIAEHGITNAWQRLQGSNRNYKIYLDYYCPEVASYYTTAYSEYNYGFAMKNIVSYSEACGLQTNEAARNLFINIDRAHH